MTKRALATLAVLGVAWTLPAQAAPAELKMALWGPPQAYLNAKVLVPWAKRVSAASGGTISIRVYSNTLGNPRTVYGNIKNGVADLGWVIQPAVRGKFKRTSVVELPFLFEKAEAGSVAAWRLYAKGLTAAEYNDVKPLAIVTFPPAQIHANFAIRTLADLKGKKVRIGGRNAGFAAKLLGAAPIYVAVADIYTSLGKGVIGGAMIDWGGVRAFRLQEVTKFHMDAPLSGIAGMVAMNNATWKRLPAQAKAAFKKHAGEALSRLIGSAADAEGQRVRDLVRKMPGHTIVKLDGAERTRWMKAVTPVAHVWAKKTPNGAAILKAMRAEIAAVRAGK